MRLVDLDTKHQVFSATFILSHKELETLYESMSGLVHDDEEDNDPQTRAGTLYLESLYNNDFRWDPVWDTHTHIFYFDSSCKEIILAAYFRDAAKYSKKRTASMLRLLEDEEGQIDSLGDEWPF